MPIITSSYARQRDAIEPAVSAALATLTECSGGSSEKNASLSASSGASSDDGNQSKSTPRILLHVFSNGGTTMATQLLLVLHAHLSAPLPLAGLLCDSCPAKGTCWRSYDAMVLSLPKDVATRLLGALACHCILLMLYTWIAWGNENPASLHRRTMLDREKVSAKWAEKCGGGEKKMMEKRAKGGMVCYFYSKEDNMCLWSDVRQHADEARKLGWDVQEVLFEGSGHCAHLMKDKERYADALKIMWEDGERNGRREKEVATLRG